MARSFLQYPFAPYLGPQLSGKPFNARGYRGTIVLADIVWPSYTVGLRPLGTANPDFTVNVNLQGVSSQVVNQQWLIRSVYVDNQNVNFPVYVYFPDTQYAVSCPANSAGWFRCFSLASAALIVAIGISDYDILNDARTKVFFSDIELESYLDQEAPTAVQQGIASPTINFGGTGGIINNVTTLNTGLWYTGGAGSLHQLIVSGGGGSGAVINGELDQYGRFFSTSIANGGSLYSSSPLLTPPNGTSAPPNWSGANSYTSGQIVGYAGIAYQCLQNNTSSVPPPNAPNLWANLGLPSTPQTAVFQTSQTPITGGVSIVNEGNFGARALGDQIVSSPLTISAAGVIIDNLFNSPYPVGFLYLTRFQLIQTTGNSVDSITLESLAGTRVLNMTATNVNGFVADLSDMNLKLPANQQFRLNCPGRTGGSANNQYNLNIVWTYSQTNR